MIGVEGDRQKIGEITGVGAMKGQVEREKMIRAEVETEVIRRRSRRGTIRNVVNTKKRGEKKRKRSRAAVKRIINPKKAGKTSVM